MIWYWKGTFLINQSRGLWLHESASFSHEILLQATELLAPPRTIHCALWLCQYIAIEDRPVKTMSFFSHELNIVIPH